MKKIVILLSFLIFSNTVFSQSNPMKANELNKEGVSVLSTNPQKALKLFQEAHKLDETVPDYPNNIGVALLNQKNYIEALPYFEKATELNPAYHNAFYNIGVCHQALNDNKSAIRAYAKTIEINPNMAEAYFNLGLVYSRMNNKKMSVSYYEKFLNVANPQTMAKPIEDAKARIKQLSEK